MEKVGYLEKVCATNEIILIDTNILSHKLSPGKTITEDIYDSDADIVFDEEMVQNELEYTNQLKELFSKNTNIYFATGVIRENQRFSDILQEQVNYQAKRLRKEKQKLDRKGEKKKSTKGKKKRKGAYQTGEYTESDYVFDKERLDLLQNYATSIFQVFKIINKRQAPQSSKYFHAFDLIKNITKKYDLKRISQKRILTKKIKKQNLTDEQLVAKAFCLSFDQPVHLISFDRDILRISNCFWKFLRYEKFQKRFGIPKNPVHLHTWCFGRELNNGYDPYAKILTHKQSYIVIPHKSQACPV